MPLDFGPLSSLDHGLAEGRLSRLLAPLDAFVKGAADDAWIGTLGIPDLTGFVDLLAGEAEFFCRCRQGVPVWNGYAATVLGFERRPKWAVLKAPASGWAHPCL